MTGHNLEPDNTREQDEPPQGKSWLGSGAEKAAFSAGIVTLVVILCCCSGLIINYLLAQG